MKLADRVKSISHFKAHAPEMIRDIAKHREPVVITLRGEAKAVLQDLESYEEAQETLALLKILALSSKDIAEGRVRTAVKAFARIRRRVKR